MTDRAEIEQVLSRIALPGGGDLMSRDMVRALAVEGPTVRFIIEAPSPDEARALEPVRKAAEAAVAALPGVETVSVLVTAHGPSTPRAPARPAAAQGEPPSLKIGRHPTPQAGPAPVPGVDRIIAVGSGKGGVGKSTVSTNLAVALAREGRRVGLLDADIYGPSVPRMMGVSERPKSPDGKTIIPLHAHGVTTMSIGLMVDPDKAVVWRGPMLMGALQQMLGQVEWGELDILIVDLPPGTGDVQLTLCQKTHLTGAIVVSTPQDVALLDARKAIDMFGTLKTPILGLVENMSLYICPNCGHEAHIFGHGGVGVEAEKMGVPLLGSLPIDLDTRLAGDGGTPIAAGEGIMSDAYRRIARGLIQGGMA
ncbi:Mrp/NBP35 family ATP-binding protein [Ponticoccus sp. SC2-23]|uniref:Mrp/NBP35 family ATP-binding protein n=1 Tax=Alexandriicola marinus TaxID=2081710 RepID=UPI000FDA11D2|nr:Mrp/NBP35 family ATP-binding protein [Alexandriicola marinus]MBM1219502.1 Mrp/NBP35 family ATP-binding protein [Ponticoccus sp. SC6-9]MBM1223426.1 Mrp/NBP35 family ATP-binding protein [Ponticoccus sp. SC6-15]MBM1229315.1 Mrp/NBP35 family ATP-binding protein [Ponticoccus sp. SC6-38]MBM1232392.1 Mrp/NBP35 family ATP-binding protein [Ponticoccus sp. SC6-45]MBM1237658.1 Mrp/NBP35 family ATP-binding protein [Ponticoccus sp. SC6-49]MBM1241403.1 Mrp/NBP35 family ATP-binding protein [Ponticoccus s